METQIATFMQELNIDETHKDKVLKLIMDSITHISKRFLVEVGHESSTTVKRAKPKQSGNKCTAVQKNGKNCENKALEESEFCGKHKNFESEESKIDNTKEKIQKEKKAKEKTPCNGIVKSGGKCSLTGAEQPEGAKFKYCYRHEPLWKDYENQEDMEEEDSNDPENVVDEESDDYLTD